MQDLLVPSASFCQALSQSLLHLKFNQQIIEKLLKDGIQTYDGGKWLGSDKASQLKYKASTIEG